MTLSSHGLRAVRAIAFVTLSSSVSASLAACSSAESDTAAPSPSASTTTTPTAAPTSAPGRDASADAIAANDAGRVPEKDAASPDAAPQDDDSGLPPGAGPLAPPEWLA